ncbi:hypothetical protein [Humitalea rosea]|uniref:hypothetical protein n=1 Tax=Humitalea rosea TaxID=990373 RepID=UPI0011B420F8|nr:hypothetical protein [Humitalea rosea]
MTAFVLQEPFRAMFSAPFYAAPLLSGAAEPVFPRQAFEWLEASMLAAGAVAGALGYEACIID